MRRNAQIISKCTNCMVGLRELEKQEKLYADAEAAQRKASEVPDPRKKPDASEPSA